MKAADAKKIVLWTEGKDIHEFMIARGGWLIFDVSYPGEMLYGSRKMPVSAWRPYYNVSFIDGDADVFLSTGFDEKYYRILLAVSVIAGFSSCLGIIILGMKENVNYIQCLKREVDDIKQGNLQKMVTVKGNDELGQLAHGLDQMRIQLHEKEEREKKLRAAQEKLVLGMSHDLRTPLTGLLTYMEVLKKQEWERRASCEYIDKAYDKILQIKCLSDRMFEYFFIDSHQGVELEPPEEINSVFGDYLSELCAMLDCSGFHVNDDALKWKRCFVQVNMDYIGRIINNIFSNVEKYADRDKEVKIWIIYEQERVGIAVKNGMATPNKYVEGTGIGVKNISLMMEQMGGTAEVEMTEKDYRIAVYFPCVYIKE